MNETAENAKNPWQVSDLLEKTLPERARNASDRLRALMATKMIVELSETKRRFLIDWTSKELAVTLVGTEIQAETTIQLSERTLNAISRGDLNPQLAFVSGAVHIVGKTEPAIYLFNLLIN